MRTLSPLLRRAPVFEWLVQGANAHRKDAQQLAVSNSDSSGTYKARREAQRTGYGPVACAMMHRLFRQGRSPQLAAKSAGPAGGSYTGLRGSGTTLASHHLYEKKRCLPAMRTGPRCALRVTAPALEVNMTADFWRQAKQAKPLAVPALQTFKDATGNVHVYTPASQRSGTHCPGRGKSRRRSRARLGGRSVREAGMAGEGRRS